MSLFWLLQEPLVHEARLDIQDTSKTGLSQRLYAAGAVRLKHLVDAAGPRLHDTEAVTSLLGMRSSRQVRALLDTCTTRFTAEELNML